MSAWTNRIHRSEQPPKRQHKFNQGRLSDSAQAALSGSHRNASGSAGGYLL